MPDAPKHVGKRSLSLRNLRVLVFLTSFTSAAFGEVSFNGEIRPLLSDRCFTCHGPDGGKDGENWKGGLRLDKEADAFADLVLYLIKLVLIKPKLARFPHRALAFHLSRVGGIYAFTLAS
jgi:hypothetical protein